jgi:hypothetical protein
LIQREYHTNSGSLRKDVIKQVSSRKSDFNQFDNAWRKSKLSISLISIHDQKSIKLTDIKL